MVNFANPFAKLSSSRAASSRCHLLPPKPVLRVDQDRMARADLRRVLTLIQVEPLSRGGQVLSGGAIRPCDLRGRGCPLPLR